MAPPIACLATANCAFRTPRKTSTRLPISQTTYLLFRFVRPYHHSTPLLTLQTLNSDLSPPPRRPSAPSPAQSTTTAPPTTPTTRPTALGLTTHTCDPPTRVVALNIPRSTRAVSTFLTASLASGRATERRHAADVDGPARHTGSLKKTMRTTTATTCMARRHSNGGWRG